MSYFSRLSLDPASLEATDLLRATIGDAYREHQLLWDCFGKDPAASRDFVFRREVLRGQIRYFVVSARQPFAPLPWIVETKEYEPKVAEGQILAFSLRANPVVSRRDDKGKQKRHDIVMDAKAKAQTTPGVSAASIESLGYDWLSSRAAQLGFVVADENLVVDGYRQNQGRKRRASKPIRFSTLDFSGRLRVTDSQRFKVALMEGIGPAKAFGCGLLLVRRC